MSFDTILYDYEDRDDSEWEEDETPETEDEVEDEKIDFFEEDEVEDD